MKGCILGLYRDNGNENGIYKSIMVHMWGYRWMANIMHTLHFPRELGFIEKGAQCSSQQVMVLFTRCA